MLFTGEYEHTIDAKHRLAIPSEVRSRMDPSEHGEALYIGPGPNGHLWLWPEKTFEKLAASLEQSLLPGEESMEFEEMLFSQAARLEIDKAGRVRLPERSLRWAGLESSVVLLGVRDHLELRDPTDWYARREEKLAKQGQIILRARRAMQEGHRHE